MAIVDGHWACRACAHRNAYEDGPVCENCGVDNSREGDEMVVNEGAFKRAFEAEMHGALEDWWYDWLRGNAVFHYGSSPLDAGLRARAKELAASGARPWDQCP